MSKEHGADARPVLLIRTISFSFALLLLIALGVFAARMWQTTDVLSKQGSRGNEVRQIQQKLKNWGYYFGEVDGIFGVQTKKAVMDFQRKNGLAVDGIAGNATLRAMGIYSSQQTSGSGGYSDSDIALLANIISAEARGEPFEGQVAVGAVVLNRVEHPSFPDTLPGVVYQPGAFTAITDRADQRGGRRIGAQGPRARRWRGPTRRAARSTIIIPTRPPTSGSVPGR